MITEWFASLGWAASIILSIVLFLVTCLVVAYLRGRPPKKGATIRVLPSATCRRDCDPPNGTPQAPRRWSRW